MSMTAIPPTTDELGATGSQRFVLQGIEWSAYRKISEALTGRHLRMSYDRGRLELLTISGLHGTLCRLLARLVETLTEEFGLPCRNCGDMTCDCEPLERGIEPDECFYIENEPTVREKDDIDLTVDPPPDLAIEVDVTRDSRNRLSIYGAIGVPEVWRFDGTVLTVYLRQADGSYQSVDRSPRFSVIPAVEMEAILAQRTSMDQNALVRRFRARVRELLSSSTPSS